MQAITLPRALDQIPGTRTTRRIVELLKSRIDARGIAALTRRELSKLLAVTERTLTRLVGQLEAFGLLARYGLGFVFHLSQRLTDRPVHREDAETEAQAEAAFVDGRERSGASSRPAHPSAAPFILSHARAICAGELKGANLIQICRLMGEAYADEARTPNLERENFPIHPMWIGPAMDVIGRAVLVRWLAERSERRRQQEAARSSSSPELGSDRAARRAAALAFLGRS
jgi:hypothetical protein